MELIRAKKSLGQNFLTNRSVINRIIETVDCGPNDWVLEVGPGRGALTTLLADSGAHVVAVELDRQLFSMLDKTLADRDNVEIIQGDILKLDLQSLLGDRWSGKWKVAANLPYNISSQVLVKFLDSCDLFSKLVLMLQKEVGDRLSASPATKEYGILTVLCNLHFDIRKEFIVHPGSFKPVPKVDSAVLSFSPLSSPRAEVGDEALFRRLVKASFNQRRKTLHNCLRSAEIMPNTEQLLTVLDHCGIDGRRRGETLTLFEFAALTKAVMDHDAGRI